MVIEKGKASRKSKAARAAISVRLRSDSGTEQIWTQHSSRSLQQLLQCLLSDTELGQCQLTRVPSDRVSVDYFYTYMLDSTKLDYNTRHSLIMLPSCPCTRSPAVQGEVNCLNAKIWSAPALEPGRPRGEDLQCSPRPYAR